MRGLCSLWVGVGEGSSYNGGARRTFGGLVPFRVLKPKMTAARDDTLYEVKDLWRYFQKVTAWEETRTSRELESMPISPGISLLHLL